MHSLPQALDHAARRGTLNLLFEHSMYALIDDLHRITTLLHDAGVPFEVVGGMAINAHLFTSHPHRAFTTRDVDLLVNRDDLPAILTAAGQAGYTGRKILGGFMLLLPGQQPAEAVHLLFVGEKPRSNHPLPNPPLSPEPKHLPQYNIQIPVAPLQDLVRMKLNAFRPKDEAHLEILDSAGLITPAIEQTLPPVLQERLAQARSRYSPDEFSAAED